MNFLKRIANTIIANFKIISLWDVSENFSRKQYFKILVAMLLSVVTAMAKVLAPAALAKAVEMIALSEEEYDVSFLTFQPSGLLYLSVALTTWIKSETYLKRLLTREFEILHIEKNSDKLIAASHHIAFETHQQNKPLITRTLLEILNNQNKLTSEVLNNIAPSFIDILIGLILIWRRYGNVLGSEFLIYLILDICLLTYFVDFVTNHSAKMAKTDKRLQEFVNREFEIINNEETVRTFHHEELEARLSKNLLTKYLSIYGRFLLAEDIAAVLKIIPIIIANIIPITLLLKENLSLHDLDDFVFLLSYINLFGGSIASFNQAMRNCFRAIQSIEAQNAFQQQCLISSSSLSTYRLRSDFSAPLIEFKNVIFCYPQSTTPVLQGISFSIVPGKHVGIIGKSNAGKSTIVKLLFGLYRHQQGDILLNGHRIESIPKYVLARIFCCIPQNTELFRDRSLKYNVTYGAENEDLLYHCATQKTPAMVERNYHTLDVEDNFAGTTRLDQDYQAAMIKVNLENLLQHSDDKAKATSLSGGQRQRVGLARALVRHSEVFVFDESSSALDSFTESEVLANIKEITKGKTSIMITHRVATLRNADDVLVIENGKVVEQGNPESLLQRPGVFSRYWQAQVGLRM